MIKFASFIVLLALISCNSGTPAATTTTTDSTKKEVMYPYPIGYSSQFEFIDPAKGKMILGIWKDYDNNNVDNCKDKFADTVTMIFPEMSMHASRDSIFAATKSYRNTFKSVISKVDVVMSVRSTDKKGDWVLVWGDETHTTQNNKTDSVALHEVWGLNKDGKIEFMQQYVSKK